MTGACLLSPVSRQEVGILGPEIGEVIILKHFDLILHDTFLPSRSLLLKVSDFFPKQCQGVGTKCSNTRHSVEGVSYSSNFIDI